MLGHLVLGKSVIRSFAIFSLDLENCSVCIHRIQTIANILFLSPLSPFNGAYT